MESLFGGSGESLFRHELSTFILLLVVFLLRVGLYHAFLKRQDLVGETRRRWAINIRNALLVVLVFGIVFIWAPQLRTFAVSLFAVAMAITIATKELLDCFSGNGLRIVTKAFSLGDQIEVAGVRGKVVDVNMMTTTLLEIGPGNTSNQYTGRAKSIPNSMLLRNPITNESYSKDYRIHIITVPLSAQDDWKAAEVILLTAAQEECQPFIEEARRHMKELEGKIWLDAPSVEPRVSFQLPKPGRVNLLLRIPCPTRFTSRLEQTILRRFLSEFRYASLSAPFSLPQQPLT